METRTAGKALIAGGTEAKVDREVYIYPNNWVEGNALEPVARSLMQIGVDGQVL